MTGVITTAKVDTSVLRSAIPGIVAFGRRTIAEQCVTSIGIICINAQKATPATSIGQIDEELSVTASPGLLKSGKPSKAKNRQREVVSVPERGLASMIVVARMHPGSNYSRMTGNRWPVAVPQTSGIAAFWSAVQTIAARMVKARHSSTHFLQHGWTPAIRMALSSPYFKAWRSIMRSAATRNPNPINRISGENLGGITINLSGDACVVTAENDVGGSGNAVLAEKHRQALIAYGTAPLQQAVDKEALVIYGEIDRRLEAGLKQNFANLLA